MREDEAALQEHLGQIPEAQLIAQAPEDDQGCQLRRLKPDATPRSPSKSAARTRADPHLRCWREIDPLADTTPSAMRPRPRARATAALVAASRTSVLFGQGRSHPAWR